MLTVLLLCVLHGSSNYALARCVLLLQHHPIFLERLGKLDGVRIEKEGIPDETILNYHLREMEYMAQVRVKE